MGMTELQRVAIRGIGVSPQQQFLSPLVAPLCVSLATRDTVTVLRWTSHSIRGQGNQIYVSFSLRGIPAALLRVPPNSLRARGHAEEGCCRCPSQPPVSYGFPGVSVAMGMFSFKLWWVSLPRKAPRWPRCLHSHCFPSQEEGERAAHW